MLKLGKTQELYKGEFITLYMTPFVDKEGNDRRWEFMHKQDAVIVFPITDDQKIVLIKNYRIPLRQYVVEVPAGLMDTPDVSGETVAKRELLEETGYTARTFIPVQKFPYRCGSADNYCHGFIALGLEKVPNAQIADDTEDIEVIEVPYEGFSEWYFRESKHIMMEVEILHFLKISEWMKIL